MSEIKRPVNQHDQYHAHVYFDESNVEQAREFCADIAKKFPLPVGHFHEKMVGPHPMWSCQVMFRRKYFDDLVAWLEENRQGLTILIHGDTGNDLKDHTDYAYWLGDSVELKLAQFK